VKVRALLGEDDDDDQEGEEGDDGLKLGAAGATPPHTSNVILGDPQGSLVPYYTNAFNKLPAKLTVVDSMVGLYSCWIQLTHSAWKPPGLVTQPLNL
jgi:hypothetical protein